MWVLVTFPSHRKDMIEDRHAEMWDPDFAIEVVPVG